MLKSSKILGITPEYLNAISMALCRLRKFFTRLRWFDFIEIVEVFLHSRGNWLYAGCGSFLHGCGGLQFSLYRLITKNPLKADSSQTADGLGADIKLCLLFMITIHSFLVLFMLLIYFKILINFIF